MKEITNSRLVAIVASGALLCASTSHAALLAHYTYESGTVNSGTVADQSGTGAIGIRSGGGSFATSTDAAEGLQSLSNTTSIAITRGTVNSATNEASFASWYKGSDSSGYFFDQGQGGRFISSIGYNNGGTFGVWLGGTWYNSGVSTTSITDNAWHHLAFVWGNDGTDATATIYVDGTALDWGGGVTTKTLTGEGMISLTSTDTGGAYQRYFSDNTGAAASRLTGLVDDTRIYDNALTASEVAVIAAPEPSSAALLGLGGLALILRRRK